jgi:hypothetical protein
MRDADFFDKWEFVQLMRRKRGTDFAFGWLAMSYAMPPMPEEAEQELIRKEIPVLEALPDYDGV